MSPVWAPVYIPDGSASRGIYYLAKAIDGEPGKENG